VANLSKLRSLEEVALMLGLQGTHFLNKLNFCSIGNVMGGGIKNVTFAKC
jgi:hypothetical protein